VKITRFRRPKATFSLMWNIDLIQIQQYYEKQVTLSRHHMEGRGSKRRKLRR
jgi:hypothetical protein